MRPLAMAGAAPRTTTKRIAVSERPKSRIVSGNHAIVGIVWRPVSSEPTAARTTRLRETTRPMTRPSATARP
jgi:hypothetical protein